MAAGFGGTLHLAVMAKWAGKRTVIAFIVFIGFYRAGRSQKALICYMDTAALKPAITRRTCIQAIRVKTHWIDIEMEL